MPYNLPTVLEDLKNRFGAPAVFPVPEGGWFLPTWCAQRGTFEPPVDDVPPNEPGVAATIHSRTPGSSGYYVLEAGELGALHLLECAAIYTFIEGNPIDICCIEPSGDAKVVELGPKKLTHLAIPGRVAHAVLAQSGEAGYSLMHLVTIPGFEPEDAAVLGRASLLTRFPQHQKLIQRFTHQSVGKPPPLPTVDAYMDPSHGSGVRVVPLLTVGDRATGTRFVGAPDGLGAFRDPDNSDRMRVLITHELFFHQGVVRAHGAVGAFVSEWVFDLSQWDEEHFLRVLGGTDLIREQHYWSFFSGCYKSGKALPFERLCSADLPPPTALQFQQSKKEPLYGTTERLFMGGEETHTRYRADHGRALAHVVTGEHRGETWELPRLGRCSYENILLCPLSQRKTIAILLDDATNVTTGGYSKRDVGSEVYVYVGEKQIDDHPVKAAGLLDGKLYGIRVERFADGAWTGVPSEDRLHRFGHSGAGKGYRFALQEMSDKSDDQKEDEPGVAQQKESLHLEITRFLRVEDGAWDSRDCEASHFYFVTTDEYDGVSRLFGLGFDDVCEPEKGGELHILLEGKEPGMPRRFQMLDSLSVDPWGRILLQEDAGRNPERSRTLVFDPGLGVLRVAAEASVRYFEKASPHFLTTDEESTGIIPVFDLLGDGWYLSNLQAHAKGKFPEGLFFGLTEAETRHLKRELVEPGQLLAIYIPKDISKLPPA